MMLDCIKALQNVGFDPVDVTLESDSLDIKIRVFQAEEDKLHFYVYVPSNNAYPKSYESLEELTSKLEAFLKGVETI